MRPRTELAIALGITTALGLVVAAAGSRGRRTEDADPRRSTYLVGPYGARAYAEALELLGVRVTRLRARVRALSDSGMDGRGAAFVALDPAGALSPLDALHLRRFAASGGSLLLAGEGTGAVMRCYGYETKGLPGGRVVIHGDTVPIGATLQPPLPAATERGQLLDDGSAAECPRVAVSRVDTLLATAGQPVALRVFPDSGGSVVLVSDGTLFANRIMRDTGAGEFALGLVVGRQLRVIIDEYHHGFGPGGGMVAAVRSWSGRSPWGWMLWQLLAVGVLALLASAIRFGPARRVIERRRRSPLEHVRALATALAAARGHEVAVGLLVRGLRRRLARPGEPLRGDPRAWLAALAERVRTPMSKSAVTTLQSLIRGPVGADGVRRAALAVEDVWQDLKP